MSNGLEIMFSAHSNKVKQMDHSLWLSLVHAVYNKKRVCSSVPVSSGLVIKVRHAFECMHAARAGVKMGRDFSVYQSKLKVQWKKGNEIEWALCTCTDDITVKQVSGGTCIEY